MRVLLTNDDGIHAEGLQALRCALLGVPAIELVVIAPDSNRSAVGRGITIARALWTERIDFGDGTHGYSTDGTPVDCVRLAALGLVEGFEAELIVSGINHGSNLGDDITYSGTVAAAFEGILLGLPAVAVSQQFDARWADAGAIPAASFEPAASFVARLVAELADAPLEPGTLLNVNAPTGEPAGVEVCRLGKRVYRDELQLRDTDPDEPHRRQFFIYGGVPGHEDEPGTDLSAVADGRIAVTPVHFALTHDAALDALSQQDLDRLMAPAARGVQPA